MIKKLSLSLAAMAILAGCGSSSSGGSGSSNINSTALTTFDGTTTLPNGTQISTIDSAKFIAPGQITTTRLIIKGGQSSNYALSAIVYKMLNGVLTPSSDINVSFASSNITTGSAVQTDNVTIDTTKATAGNYQIKVIATPVTQTSVSGTSTQYNVATLGVSTANTNMIKASYLQLDATGSLSAISKSGYQSSNIILFAFADPSSSSINQSYLTVMQTAINNESAGTLNFLSLGGQYATTANFNTSNASQIVSAIVAQVKAYNSQLTGGQINGVDLDLENSIDSATITALAQGFQSAGLLVSTAPQVYLTSGTSVDVANPTNLGLTSGGANNQYGPAIAAGYVDYILAQTYNTGGFTVGGYNESQVQFFQTISQALSNAVKSSCSGVTTLCIPAGVNIAIGEPSNAGASGTVNNLFASNGATSYNQSAILSQLSSYITSMQGNSLYSNIKGVMQWSLNNDYLPTAWSDSFASVGAFSSTIFGATPPPTLPSFSIQISNTGPNVAGPYAYASATFVVNGAYDVAGTNWSSPIAPQASTTWGTKTSAQANPTTVSDSTLLDNYFITGATSFTTSQILINGYPSQANLYSPPGQWNCPIGANYTFQAGHSYNVMVNAASQTCDIKQIN